MFFSLGEIMTNNIQFRAQTERQTNLGSPGICSV